MENIEIHIVSNDKKDTLINLLQFYVYDFSEFTGNDLTDEGLYTLMPEINDYWEQQNLYKPLLVSVDGRLAGFVIVQLTKDIEVQINYLKHFFVLKKFRNKGIGRGIAFKVFDMFNGNWKVSELMSNKPSQVFWNKVINEYTQGNFRDFYDRDRRIRTFVASS